MTCISPTGGPAICVVVSEISVATGATVVIAALTLCVFILQIRQHRHDRAVADANYRLSLHEKRLETLFEVREVLENVFRDGQPSIDDAFRIRRHVQTARYLFPEDVIEFLNEISEKAFDHYRQYRVWEPLRKRAWEGETLSEEDTTKKQTALDAKLEIENWFFQFLQNNRLEETLAPYLKLPDSL